MSIGLEILKGQETSLVSHGLNNGRLYFCTDTGNVFLDTNNENENDVSRLQINANRAYYLKSKNETLYIDENFISLGRKNETPGNYSIAVGLTNSARGEASVAFGNQTTALGLGATAFGFKTEATEDYSFATGYQTAAIGLYSSSEGLSTRAFGTSSHAEGELTLANGNTSHAEGYENLALGRGSHAEGMWNLAFGNWSHAEGGNIHQLRELQVTAAANSKSVKIINDQWCQPGIYVGDVLYYSGDYAQITAYDEDTQTLTLNKALSTKALNSTTVHLFCGAIGMGSHVEGLSCRAVGDYSHAQNIKTIALGRGQTVIGRSNIPDTESAFIIGGDNKNIYQIDWDGNSAQTGSLQIGSYFILGDESYGYDLPEAGVENQLFFQAVAGNELTTGNYEEYLPLDFIIHDTITPSQSVNKIQVPSKLQVFDLEDFSLYADGLLLTQGLYYYFDTNYQTYFDFYLKPDVVLEYVINTSENKEEMDKILGRMGF